MSLCDVNFPFPFPAIPKLLPELPTLPVFLLDVDLPDLPSIPIPFPAIPKLIPDLPAFFELLALFLVLWDLSIDWPGLELPLPPFPAIPKLIPDLPKLPSFSFDCPLD